MPETKEHEDILEIARKRFTRALDAEQENMDRAIESINFTIGEQWHEDIIQERTANNLPSLVFNQCDTLVSRVAGGIMADIPLLTVIPEEESDLIASKSIHKMLKHIERVSRAENIYQNCAEDALDGGFGYFRILPRYSKYDGFEQEIFMQYIKDRFNAHLDPASDDDNYEDGKFGFIEIVIEKEEFEDEYGENVDEFFGGTEGNQHDKWFFDSKVRVAEYFWKEPLKRTLLTLTNILTGKEINVYEDEMDGEPLGENGLIETDRREIDTHKVMWGKMTGHKFLEGPQEFPCDFIPIVKVRGKEKNVKGKRQFFSLIENVKAPQRLLNYALTTESLIVGMQPMATWMAAKDLVEGVEDVYANSHNESVALLTYTRNPQYPQDKPERLGTPVSSQGFLNLIEFANQNIETSSGVTEAFLGRKSNEISGKAIQTRAAGSALVTSVFGIHVLQGITYGGRIMISMIQHLYKEPNRIIRVLGEKDGFDYIKVNEKIIDPETGEITIINDVSKNTYDYVVEASSSFKTKRRENVAVYNQMLALAVNNPALQALLSSEIVKNMDVDNAAELSQQILTLSGLGGGEGSAPAQQAEGAADARATALTP